MEWNQRTFPEQFQRLITKVGTHGEGDGTPRGERHGGVPAVRPYPSELDEIELVFWQVKYQEIPRRSHTTRASLRAAVDAGSNGYGRGLKSKSEKKPRQAA